MLKEIIDAFRGGDDTISGLLRQFGEMLEKCAWIFSHTDPHGITSADIEDLHGKIYAEDKQINELERTIRYQILGHLTVNPGSEASTCMALMVICKDAERIGDYCKNVFEVLAYCGPSRYASIHVDDFGDLRQKVEDMMLATRKAFRKSDVITAQRVISDAGTISAQADLIVQHILQGKLPDDKEPAARALLARHYKRISSHLSNICTSVTSPVDMLGYYDEARMKRA